MTRVFACKGDDAAMEVYIPQSAVTGVGVANAKLDRPVTGAYTLDLTDAGKGKSLEPVRVSLSADKKFVIVDQFTRKLPPATSRWAAERSTSTIGLAPMPNVARSIGNEARRSRHNPAKKKPMVKSRRQIRIPFSFHQARWHKLSRRERV